MSEPDRKCACQGCDWTGRVDQLACQIHEIPDFFERVAEGEICPVGECPKCGAVAHLVELPENTVQIVLAYAKARGLEEPDAP
jgi:hypothetical protein